MDAVTLRDLGDGRAQVVGASGTTPEADVRAALEEGFAGGLRTVVWFHERDDWPGRRLAWQLGFTPEGLLHADEAMEPRHRWLDDPVLEGERVRLRPFRDEDVARLIEALGDALAQQWLRFLPRDPTPEDGRRYLAQVAERLATGHTITWAMAEAPSDRLVGVVGLYRLAEEPELGYLTHPEARGRGLVTEAGGLALDHAFGALELPRVAAYVSAPNTASCRVLERLGFQPTGVRRAAASTGSGEVVDLAGYDLLAGERSRENANASTTSPSSASSTPTSSGER